MARVIVGLDETLAALKEFYPNTYKQMNKEIRPVLKGLVRRSQALVPDEMPHLSGWSRVNSSGRESKSIIGKNRAFPRYDANVIRKGITYSMAAQKQKNGWVGMYTLFNKSAAGSIAETAGRKNPGGNPNSRSNNPTAGVHFINAISIGLGKIYKIGASDKQRGRLIFQAFDQDAGHAQRVISAAIEKAKLSTQNRIDRAS